MDDELERIVGNGTDKKMDTGERMGVGRSVGSKNKERTKGISRIQRREFKSEQYRVVISAEANKELELGLEKVRDGSSMLKISKSDIANFMFLNLSKFILDSDIRNLHIQFLDETRFLNDLVKKAQDGHELPPDMKKLIRELSGINDKDKKKISKTSPVAVPDENLS